MIKWVKTRFWSTVASLILRNRVFCILLIVATTFFFGLQWKNIRFSFNEASLLPDKHPFNLKYQSFVDRFGDEGNLIVLAVQDSTLFSPDKIQQWSSLTKSFEGIDAVAAVTGIGNLKQLRKNTKQQSFVVEDVPYQLARDQQEVDKLEKKLIEQSLFFHGVLLNPDTEVYLTIITLKKEVVNAKEREVFVNMNSCPKSVPLKQRLLWTFTFRVCPMFGQSTPLPF